MATNDQRAQSTDEPKHPQSSDIAVWATITQSVLRVLGRKWVVAVVRELWDGPKRHFQLRLRLNGIQAKVLRDTLRLMEANGFITRVLFTDSAGSAGVGYELTALGRSLGEPLAALYAWGEAHLDTVRTTQRHAEQRRIG